MSERPLSPTRRQIMALSAAAGAASFFLIRPFQVSVPEETLVDLRSRLTATRWPECETVNDSSKGVKLAKLQPLVQYWRTDYDWRKAEARLNALPQFVTSIDGLDIQFIHERSPHPNAMPLIMTHGWPGLPLELLKTIAPLTDPAAYGGQAEDAFHLVLPTYPGYGFSGKPQGSGWGLAHVARAWHELMQRLGYKRYVGQGGDWSAITSEVMAVQAPEGLLGIPVNMPGIVPPNVLRLIRNREPAPSSFSDAEKIAYAGLQYFCQNGFGYAEMMNTRPQTLGYALSDSPVGMPAFYDNFSECPLHHAQNSKFLVSRSDPECPRTTIQRQLDSLKQAAPDTRTESLASPAVPPSCSSSISGAASTTGIRW
jgi:hypothetical protein